MCVCVCVCILLGIFNTIIFLGIRALLNSELRPFIEYSNAEFVKLWWYLGLLCRYFSRKFGLFEYSNQHFAKVLSVWRGNPKVKRENPIFPFFMQPNNWAPRDRISLNLVYSLDAWIVLPSWGNQNTHR